MTVLLECWHDLFGDELQLAHDVPVRHAGEEEPADEVRQAVLGHEGLERLADLVRAPDEEAFLHEPIEIRGDRGIDERMLPAAGVLLAIRDHDVALRELAERHIMVSYRKEYAGGWKHPFIDASIATDLDGL